MCASLFTQGVRYKDAMHHCFIKLYFQITFLCAVHSRDPSEMFTELHREEKREKGDRGGHEDRGGNQKETDPASNQLPKCSQQSGTHEQIHRVG